MKIDRMLGILSVLSQKKRVKAKELAERFEVSLRTIYRDVDVICQAGFPIITYPGGEGGIGIAEGFVLDKNILTGQELQSILLGLKGLESVMAGPQIPSLLKKLSPEPGQILPVGSDIVIDLATHYRDSLSPKISLLREGIALKRTVRFDYFAKTGWTRREAEPLFITFKWAGWYLFAFCRLRGDFRLFKLNRMTKLELTEEHFEQRQISEEQLDLEAFYNDPQRSRYATLLLDKSLSYVMVDEYGPDSYTDAGDGKILAKWDYVDEASMVKTVLGLGGGAKVLEPESLARAVEAEAEKILLNYREDDIQLSGIKV